MRSVLHFFFCAFAALCALRGAQAADGAKAERTEDEIPREPFDLHDGDRVVFVGGAFFERELQYGHIEAALSARWPDRHITFRNLGLSGETVFGDSRAGFETAKEGYQRLIEETKFTKPTVIFLAFGENESSKGEAGVEVFIAGLDKLIGDLKETGARFVILSPYRHEKLASPMPNPQARNEAIELYAAALKKYARANGHRYVDLMKLTTPDSLGDTPFAITDDGIHLTSDGYRRATGLIMQSLRLKLSEVERMAEPTARSAIQAELDAARMKKLRQLIIEKNRLYFHRYRPENWTYLFGHRVHEQGRNAKEIPQFDPLIEQKEKEISELLNEGVGNPRDEKEKETELK
ncbi:SGNH/GDSL hydrolase family protein [Candidatus Sumerlaeota bacterium]|nr:SGNH/GDSL hydrolase family protein [Candidatus Sumerlaeota bacterium]